MRKATCRVMCIDYIMMQKSLFIYLHVCIWLCECGAGVEKYTLRVGNITPISLGEWSAKGNCYDFTYIYIYTYIVNLFLIVKHCNKENGGGRTLLNDSATI